MAPRQSQKRASLKWDKENMITLGCKIKRTHAAAFKAYCEDQGKTSNTVLKDYVLECIGERDASQEATGSPTSPVEAGMGILTPDTLNVAQQAANAAGEPLPDFVRRAVETQAQRDAMSRRMKGGKKDE